MVSCLNKCYVVRVEFYINTYIGGNNNMKKILTFMFAFMFFATPIKTYANSAVIEIVVNGEVKKGSTIEILVNVKDVNKFYAASIDFIYDINQLKIESISASDFITKHNNDIMEFGGETEKHGNTASYSFTFLGEKDGIKGSGTIVVISAKVLNDEKLSIGQNNMKIKLVQRVNDTVENYSFKFLGYNNKGNSEVSGGENSTTNNNENSQDTLSNNSLSSSESNRNNQTESDSKKEKNETTGSNKVNSNNTENNDETTYKNNEVLEKIDNINGNYDGVDEKSNIEEKNILTSKNSNKESVITIGIIFTLVVVGGVAGYYFIKKK